MSEPFLGEIKIFAGSFAPRGWHFCDGTLLQVSQNEALFSLLGTVYGGDGRTTFGLPDLRGRAPLHVGQGPGLSTYQLGQQVGAETVTLTANQTAPHTHDFKASPAAATSVDPATNVLAQPSTGIYLDDTANIVSLNAASIGDSSGSSQAHNNMQPYLTVNFIIALVGILPTQT